MCRRLTSPKGLLVESFNWMRKSSPQGQGRRETDRKSGRYAQCRCIYVIKEKPHLKDEHDVEVPAWARGESRKLLWAQLNQRQSSAKRVQRTWRTVQQLTWGCRLGW